MLARISPYQEVKLVLQAQDLELIYLAGLQVPRVPTPQVR